MKRILSLLAAVMLMVSGAGAEMITVDQDETAAPDQDASDVREADLMDIRQKDGEDRIWITAAIQTTDGVLLTSTAVLPEKTDELTVWDGETEWEVEAVIPDSTGVMALVFFDPGEHLPRLSSWPLMPYGESVKASTCVVRSGDAEGGRTNRGVLSATETEWMNCRCFLLDLEEEAPVGSAVLNARGELAGMVAADYAEGEGRVLVLPAEEIARGITEAGEYLGFLAGWGEATEGYHVTVEKNLVTFDWSEMTLPAKAEGEEIYLVVADAANRYLSFFPAETAERRLSMILTPGRIYISGIVVCAGAPDTLPEQYEVTVVPPAKNLTEYNFHPTLTTIAEMPENAEGEQAPVPVTEITEELLRSGRAYFYSVSTYEIEEERADRTLLVTLTDPEGNNYRYETAWMYSPAFMKEDIWYFALTGTALTWSLDQIGYPKGIYRMAYYVGGDLADQFTFEIK